MDEIKKLRADVQAAEATIELLEAEREQMRAMAVHLEAARELLLEFAQTDCAARHYAAADDSWGSLECAYCTVGSDDKHADTCRWMRARALLGIGAAKCSDPAAPCPECNFRGSYEGERGDVYCDCVHGDRVRRQDEKDERDRAEATAKR